MPKAYDFVSSRAPMPLSVDQVVPGMAPCTTERNGGLEVTTLSLIQLLQTKKLS